MPRLHSLELLPDEAGREAVVALWQRLRDAELPSQLDHRGSTNAPHVSVVEAPGLPDAALDVAQVRLGGLLPVRASAAGLLVLGQDRVTVALSVALDDDVVRRVLAVRVQVPDRAHGGWLPHLTLARRVERADLPRVLDALGAVELDLRLTELRRWDPERGHVTSLAGGA